MFPYILFGILSVVCAVKVVPKFRRLNELVATKYKTRGKIICVSCQIVGKMFWLKLLQWANNSIEHREDKTVVLSYVYKGKIHKVVSDCGRGPSKILLVFDENEDDVGHIVLPYLGPNQDWHGRKFQPSFWKRERLTFELCSGDQKTFEKDQVIDI